MYLCREYQIWIIKCHWVLILRFASSSESEQCLLIGLASGSESFRQNWLYILPSYSCVVSSIFDSCLLPSHLLISNNSIFIFFFLIDSLNFYLIFLFILSIFIYTPGQKSFLPLYFYSIILNNKFHAKHNSIKKNREGKGYDNFINFTDQK